MDLSSSRQMVIDTDYPMDKVIKIPSGSFTMTASGNGYVVIPHGLPFKPLCGGNWSLVSNFSVQYEFSSGPYPAPFPGFIFSRTINVYADATNIYLSYDNLSSAVTAYYRIYCFQPPQDNSLIPSVVAGSDSYTINSELNNSKLAFSGRVNLPAGTGSTQLVNVIHNLGVIPQAIGWIDYPFTLTPTGTTTAIHPVGTTNSANQNITMVVNNVEIVYVIPAGVSAVTAYYRIYLDE